ncbi:MAG: spermidine synthase [candidate division WOR-3 bacterium]
MKIENKYYVESFLNKILFYYKIENILYTGQTKFQKVDILRVSLLGKTVFLDEKIQSAECDEFIYHESLVHPALLLHSNPEFIYIAGGGEGATLREVLKHRSVKKVRMCDIDEEFVNLCKVYLPEWHRNSFDDERAEIVFKDAREDIESLSDDSLDIYISDLTEPIEGGPSALLFTEDYFKILDKKLRKGGISVFQAGSTVIYYYDFILSLYKTLKEIFPSVFIYEIFVPSFHMSWGFVISFKENLNLKEILNRLENKRENEIFKYLNFLNPPYLKKIFFLPEYFKSSLNTKGRILTDKTPFIWEGDV